MNYDIYDKELTALNRGLDEWRHLILGQILNHHPYGPRKPHILPKTPKTNPTRETSAVARIHDNMISLSSINQASSTKPTHLSRRLSDYPHETPTNPEETSIPRQYVH